MRTIDDMVRQEVLCCMSHLVSTLAAGYGMTNRAGSDFDGILEQAFELASPIPDWEETALQNGRYSQADDGEMYWHLADAPCEADAKCVTAEGFCVAHDIDPYEREVFEHWAVSTWFAEKLAAAGEKVDPDFAGLCVWARTCSGQGIASDGVIQRIYAETHKP